jgi:homoserine dehydrogenase
MVAMENQIVKLGLLGFGNVHRAFAELLPTRNERIAQQHGIEFQVVGIATHSHGIAIDPDGIDLETALALDDLGELHTGNTVSNSLQFARECPADIMLEATWVNAKTGQPAINLVQAALESGKHVVTANKGPVAFAHRDLTKLAAKRNLAFFYESTVMDGTPLHSIAREGLLAAEVISIRGVLNSTTNAILTQMEEGIPFDEALKAMQKAGIAETDPSNDIDGWDSALKLVILANTLMGADLRPADVDPTGIRSVSMEDVQDIALDGFTLKLLCEAHREADGLVRASVMPTPLEPDDPLAWLDGTAAAVTIGTDILEEITIREASGSPRTTAYGMLVDCINIARGRR